jgi:ABC-type sugar transport system substrate-binding protein/tRNA A-37 threonylcarbamoyl transferase component Bud32
MFANALLGQTIDDFLIIEAIGRGGMAVVYRANQRSVNRDVALKVIYLNDTVDLNDDFRKRFAQEAEVIARMEHIHILPVYSYGIRGDIAYLAMRLLRGGSVADLITRSGRLPLHHAYALFSQLAQGLAHAHSRGVIHRDLKPSNILLDDDGHPYLTDFGLAKLTSGDANVTATGNIVGTPAYMSPEQLRGEPLDYRSDIYSLGIILYQMLTGRLPFTGGEDSDVIALIYQQLQKEPERPSLFNPEISADVEAVILKAMAKDRDERFASVGEMMRALSSATGTAPALDFPTPARTLHRLTTTINRARPTVPTFMAGAGLALLLLLGVFVVWLVFNRTATYTNGTVLRGQEIPINQLKVTDAEINQVVNRMQAQGGFIAVVSCNQTSEYHAAQAREIDDFARQMGLTIRVYDSESDGYRQLIQLERALTDGATAFIICPLDIALIDESLRAIEARDIPIVMPGRPRKGNYGVVAIQTDNYLMGLYSGQVAGQIIRDEMDGGANVVVLDFTDIPDADLIARADGLEAGVLALAPGAKIIGRVRGARREWAKTSIAALIEQDIHIDAIVSINDNGSYGAIDALVEAGYGPSEVVIASVDAERLALEYIRDSYFMRASIDAGRTDYAKGAVDALVKLLAGQDVAETIIIPPGQVYVRANVGDIDRFD